MMLILCNNYSCWPFLTPLTLKPNSYFVWNLLVLFCELDNVINNWSKSCIEGDRSAFKIRVFVLKTSFLSIIPFCGLNILIIVRLCSLIKGSVVSLSGLWSIKHVQIHPSFPLLSVLVGSRDRFKFALINRIASIAIKLKVLL